MWRLMLTLMASCIFVTVSVVIAVGIGVFEFFMREAHRTIALPVYSVAISTTCYVIVACGLMRLERGTWHAPTELVGQRNVWYLMLAASAVQAWVVQVLGTLPDTPAGRSRFRWRRRWKVLKRKWLLIYAGFWQRMTDQVIALVIFSALFALSILPVSSLQTRMLFNQSFSEVIEKKIHRQNLLGDLYTPGLFHKVQADVSQEDTKGRRASVTTGRKTRTSLFASKAASSAALGAPPRRIAPKGAADQTPVCV